MTLLTTLRQTLKDAIRFWPGVTINTEKINFDEKQNVTIGKRIVGTIHLQSPKYPMYVLTYNSPDGEKDLFIPYIPEEKDIRKLAFHLYIFLKQKDHVPPIDTIDILPFPKASKKSEIASPKSPQEHNPIDIRDISSLPECVLEPWMKKICGKKADTDAIVDISTDKHGIYYYGFSGLLKVESDVILRHVVKFGEPWDRIYPKTVIMDVPKLAKMYPKCILTKLEAFCTKPKYTFLYIGMEEHARIIFKDPRNPTTHAIMIDPHRQRAPNNFVVLRKAFAEYKVKLSFQRRDIEQTGEGSCAAIALCRLFYMVWKSRKEPMKTLEAIYQPVSCAFAVFTSTLMQTVTTRTFSRDIQLAKIDEANKQTYARRSLSPKPIKRKRKYSKKL